MANILRLRIKWQTHQGGPGYTNLQFEPSAGGPIDQAVVDNAIARTEAWKSSWSIDMPNGCTTVVDNIIDEIDENSGAIQGYWTGAVAATANGNASGGYAAGSGFCVNYSTNDVLNGRRIRGRTFVVPIGSTGLQNEGTLDNTRLAVWRAATDTFVHGPGAARLTVWKRPTELGLGINGGAYDITSFSINDKVAQLGSRRH